MLVWPAVTLLGFVALAALVVVLGTRSTAQYEFERNRVQGQRQQAAVPVAAGSLGQPGGESPRPAAGTGVAATPEGQGEHVGAVGVATHPAGHRVVGSGESPAWWLVDEEDGESGECVLTGPFPDRVEADWAALSAGLTGSECAVYGVLRADGRLVRRQLPSEQAWLSELGNQLDRLAEDWDEPLSDEDALVTLVVEVAAALVETGLTLHDCAGEVPAGGVCLTPEPGERGVLLSWHQHDRMSLELVRGAATGAAVQRTMNAAIADCLQQMGFAVEPFGSTGCSLVTAAPRWW